MIVGDKWFIQQRPVGDIWEGLYQFYVVENEKLIPPEERYFKEVLSNQLLINKEVDKIEVVKKEFQQQLTHQILSLRFTKIYLNTTPAALKKGKWVKMKALVKYPFPKTINDFLLQEGYLDE
jgi:A/G-specific adenine glycosylase